MSDISSLGELFAMDSLAGAVEKKWSGGYEIRGSTVVITSMWIFQKGAILGRAKANKIKALAKLISDENMQDKMYTFFKEIGGKMLKDYGGNPSSFHDFLMKTMFSDIDFNDPKIWKKLHERKYRLGEMLQRFDNDTAMGIGFGAFQPELVKKMWVQSYETDQDPQIWADARRHGLDIPEKQSHLPLAKMEKEVLQDFSEFVHEQHPDLIPELGILP